MEESTELDVLKTSDALHGKLTGRQFASLIVVTLVIPAIMLIGVGVALA